jgi:NTP pyrophosphatase (non-canonical NTP hydrolase)
MIDAAGFLPSKPERRYNFQSTTPEKSVENSVTDFAVEEANAVVNDHLEAQRETPDLFLLSTALKGFAREVEKWANHNFGDAAECPAIIAVVGLGEEVGEVQRALLKQHQKIRGTHEEWQTEIAKELGDVLIKIADVANRAGVDMLDIVGRWHSIRSRDWKLDPLRGGQSATQ